MSEGDSLANANLAVADEFPSDPVVNDGLGDVPISDVTQADVVVVDELAVTDAPYPIIDGQDVKDATNMGKGVNTDLVILIVILVVLIGGGIFFFIRSRRTHQKVPTNEPEAQAVTEEAVTDEKVEM